MAMNSTRLDENLACDECGRHGAFDFAERKLFPKCYEACGSCCPELGREEVVARIVN
jgi:hypothetical protein